jgi:CubicO group peptidase (beta-lactamase class C family)
MAGAVRRGTTASPARGRWIERHGRHLAVGALALVALIVLVAGAGFVYLRTSPAWGAIGLFEDGRRAQSFRTMHLLFPSHHVAADGEAWSFGREERALPPTYHFAGEERSLGAFLRDSETTGLLVARGGVIVHERYAAGYDAHSLVTSFSVAKSFVSALVGIAIERGSIRSVDDAISDYVPELRGSAYDGVSIHDVLTMSSGVAFDEDYGSLQSDVMTLPVRVYLYRQPVPAILARLRRERAPGTVHEYVSSDALALGLLVSSATGLSVAQYLEETVWRPAGMEAPAAWNTDLHGHELAHGFLGATLRDYARFGRLYLDGGRRDGRPVIPAEWARASVAPAAPHLRPGEGPLGSASFGYGYQWWLPPEPEGDFIAMGIWGQFVYVHPAAGVVVVKTSTDAGFGSRFAETVAAFRAIAHDVASDAQASVDVHGARVDEASGRE